MPGGSSWLRHVQSFCPHQVSVKWKCSLMSWRQQPSSHTASHEAACLVWIGPDSPPRPVAVTVHSKSVLQRRPTLKCLCSSPLCFACLSWLTPYYMPPRDGGRALGMPALKHTCCPILALFDMWWQLFIGVWEKQMNEEGVPGGLCQLLTILNNLLFLKQTWCLLWMMWRVGVVSINKN